MAFPFGAEVYTLIIAKGAEPCVRNVEQFGNLSMRHESPISEEGVDGSRNRRRDLGQLPSCISFHPGDLLGNLLQRSKQFDRLRERSLVLRPGRLDAIEHLALG
jgi:hypothetical protein